MVFLYGNLRNESPKFQTFIDEQIESQKRWCSALKVTWHEAKAAYALFQWCDRLSLILCRRELPEAESTLEVSEGPDGTQYHVVCRDDLLDLQPWPFAETQFTVFVESFQLTKLSFQNDQELRAALETTPVTTLTWEFKKSG
jgi:hypothetical protein